MLAESERNIKVLREAIKKERLAVAAEKAALEKLQAAEAIQNDHEQRSNRWEVSPLIHLPPFCKDWEGGKVLNRVSPHQGMPRYNKKILDSVDQISMSRAESSKGMALSLHTLQESPCFS